jgi:hypothetical protein
MLMWNNSIILFQSQLTSLMLSSIINFYDKNINNGDKVSRFSQVLSILTILLVVGVLAVIIVSLRIKEQNEDY